jgi:hypothetical protein
MAVQVTFSEDNEIIMTAVEQANSLLSNEQFYNRIEQKDKFDLSTATPAQVANSIESSNLTFHVEIFYPNFLNFKYRKTLAYTDGRFPNRLFLNFKKLDRSTESIAATIIHETIHAVDDAEHLYTFGHGNNSPVGKENTAPYWIGNLAHQMLTGNNEIASLPFDRLDEDNVA